MSQNSPTRDDQPLPRNDNQRRQLANRILRTPSPPTARRTLIIEHQTEIVTTLSTLSRLYRQAIYVLKARGYVSMANFVTIPTGNILNFNGHGKILFLNGWFHPIIIPDIRLMPRSRPNGILNVSVSGVPHGLAVANRLIVSGSVEVEVLFVSGPECIIQPDAPAGPGQPIGVRVIVLPGPQPPVGQI